MRKIIGYTLIGLVLLFVLFTIVYNIITIGYYFILGILSIAAVAAILILGIYLITKK